MSQRSHVIFALVVLVAGACVAMVAAPPPGTWRTIEEGLEVAAFAVGRTGGPDDSTITVVRIDPALWELKLVTQSGTGEPQGLPARDWCRKYGLTAAINAGMFATDYRTHIGYLKADSHVNSSRVTKYQSVAAFGPKLDGIPAFRIFDTESDSVSAVAARYRNVAQNLRLIKRPGENRWEQQDQKWSEAALGEDDHGRALFIFCRTPFTMHDFNDRLLRLPIGLVAAQHLEGGPEAQLYLSAGDTTVSQVGGFETGFSSDNASAWPVPNVIGVTRRK